MTKKEQIFFLNILPMHDRRDSPSDPSWVTDYAEKSVRSGFRYTLVTQGLQRLDPWVAAQYAMAKHPRFSPLIAINPAYLPPLQAAKSISSLSTLFSQPIAYNLITGSFLREQSLAGDTLDFTGRQARLLEYWQALQGLLAPEGRSAFSGKFYQWSALEISPKYRGSMPNFFLSGQSAASFSPASGELYFIKNLRPLPFLDPVAGGAHGLGLGICARATKAEAEAAALQLFPDDRKGQMLFALAQQNKDTPWNQWFQQHAEKFTERDPDFYLAPLKNFWSAAPYLVGSYESVAETLSRHISLGYRFFLLDFHPDDFDHISRCLSLLP